MKATTSRTACLAAVLIAAVAALASTVSPAQASANTRSVLFMRLAPPKVHGYHMHWYRHHACKRDLQGMGAKYGSKVVLGIRSMRDLAWLRAAYRFKLVREIPDLRAVEVTVDFEQLRALLTNARTDLRIRYVAPVRSMRRTDSMPNDPFASEIDAWSNLPYEWQFSATHVDRAFDFTHGNPAIVVGVIDTGVADVPDLKGKIDQFWTFAPDGTPVGTTVTDDTDTYGHGTAVTSIIAATPGDHFGMVGFGGDSHVISFRACPEGQCADTSIAIALMKLDSLGVRIVNMSLGSQSPTEPILTDAVHKAAADGVLIVASAGNVNSHVGWPAADLQPSGGGRGWGIAVGATTVDGKRADFSNWGDHLSIVAPGNYIGQCSGVLVALPKYSRMDEMCFPTFTGGGDAHYGYLNGTSFAAPQVAGIAALIWAVRPDLKNYQVADIIKQSAHRDPGTGWTPTMGCGSLDAGAALELATSLPVNAWAYPGQGDDAPCSTGGDQLPTWPEYAGQTITFLPITDKMFGDPDFRIVAESSSGLPVVFSASGYCTISDTTVHITGIGTCTITASQSGDGKFAPATSVSQGFTITKARSLKALRASGRWGSRVKLGFRVGEGKGNFAVSITVQKDGKTVARLSRSFTGADSEQVYSLAWRAPKAKTKGAYRFSVQLSDEAGMTTSASSARIGLR